MRAPVLLSIGLVLAACAGEEPVSPVLTRVAFTGEEHPLAGVIWDVAAGQVIGRDLLEDRLDAADVAVLGEIHDNPRHHRRQAALVEAIGPKGLAFEMIPEASEEGIAVFLETGADPREIGPAIGWDRLGWPDWALYAPIVEAAPGARITGGASPSRDLKTAIRDGAAAAFGRGADRYGLTLAPDDDTQTVLEDEMIAAHCGKLPRSAARGMAEAQRLRDARFAHAAERAHRAGGPTVLITGNGHARTDRGVPAYLGLSQPALEVLSLGQIEVVPGAEAPGDYLEDGALPYDYVWFSARVARPDPCANFN